MHLFTTEIITIMARRAKDPVPAETPIIHLEREKQYRI